MNGGLGPVCKLCGTPFPSISLLMSHLRLVHQSETGISLVCPVRECSATYSKVNSLYSHMYRKHKELLSLHATVSKNALPPVTVRDDSSFSTPAVLDLSLPASLCYDVNQLLGRDADQQKKKSILFLMQLKEERLLTQAAINDVVAGCKEVFVHTLCRLKGNK